jgi:type II secretory pathway component PulJ
MLVPSTADKLRQVSHLLQTVSEALEAATRREAEMKAEIASLTAELAQAKALLFPTYPR